MVEFVLLLLLGLALLGLVIAIAQVRKAAMAKKNLEDRFRPIVDVDKERQRVRTEIAQERQHASAEMENERRRLASEHQRALGQLESERQRFAAEQLRESRERENERQKVVAEQLQAATELEAQRRRASREIEGERQRVAAEAESEQRRIFAGIEGDRQQKAKELSVLENQRSAASAEIKQLRIDIARLHAEFAVLDEESNFQSFGFYKPRYSFASSQLYQDKLEDNRAQQKVMLKEKTAAVCATEWQVNGSKAEGRKQINQTLKLMLRAFNGECDATTAKVKYNNVRVMEARILKAWETINGLAEVQMCSA